MVFKEIHARITGAWKREACVLTLDEIRRAICPLDETAMQTARERWDMVAKPLHSLGLLEDAVVKIAGITGTADVTLGRRAVLMMCADNGVVAEGVTQTGQEVTAIVAENAAKGDSSVCRMARIAGADVVAVDVGIARPVNNAVLNRNIRRGTRNIAAEPAMTEEEAGAALQTGIDLVRQKKAEGYGLFALGEMGIGNTTTSSAMTAVLLGQPIETVTGRGAGLSNAGLCRKREAIARAIARNHPDPADAFSVLRCLGGLDIAALAGVCLGGALYRVPVLLDGFISAAAALAAVRMCPASGEYRLARHVSKEPAGRLVLDALGLKPLICAEMCLGEGTGAVAAMPLLDMALAVYGEMRTFAEIDVAAYTPQS